jgi:asparagine synthase (glutamine-hydrolysing)
MCGIAGYLNLAAPGAGRDTLERCARALAHRGPDGEGYFQEGRIGLAHRRLAIIDLSPTGAQPMLVGHLAIAYNGEIYNYRELREELKVAGHTFASESDTEVLGRAYLHWGPSFIDRLRGMWAFAIADRQSGTLLCSRDPFGIKPLYYARHAGAYLFASEPAALLAAGVPARANLRRCAEYLAVGICDHTSDTFFAGIEQLVPGALMLIDGQGRERVLAQLDLRFNAAERTCTLDEFAARVRESVRLHLRSDVPVGTCLSGGLDSSTVAALAGAAYREDSGRQFAAVTAGSADPTRDERPFAASVVDYCGLAWHTTVPDSHRFAAEVDACIRAQGEPVLSPSAYFQYSVMRTAAEARLKVMLDGQGGDELLCGYERYVPLAVRDVARSAGIVAAARQFLRSALGTTPGLTGMTALAAYFWIPRLRRASIARRTEFLSPESRAFVGEMLESMASSYQSLAATRFADITRYSLPALLRYEDRNSMAHSVEARVPYLDRAVTDCALRLPLDDLSRHGYSKYPLRRLAAQVLPGPIAWRKSKRGFEPPVESWLAPMADSMQEAIERSALVQRLCQRVPRIAHAAMPARWRLFNLATWQQTFSVGCG